MSIEMAMKLYITRKDGTYPSWWVNLVQHNLRDARHAIITVHRGTYVELPKEKLRYIEFVNEKDATMFLLRWS